MTSKKSKSFSPNRLETKAMNIGAELRDISISDIITTLCALEDCNLESAKRKCQALFNISSGRKKIEDLNDAIKRHVGTPLLKSLAQGEWHRTKTGDQFLELMPNAVEAIIDLIETFRLYEENRLRIAATQFMVPAIMMVYKDWMSRLPKNNTIQLHQVSTGEVIESLRSYSADIVFSGCLVDLKGAPVIDSDIEFIELGKESIKLLTNDNIVLKTKEDFARLVKRSRFILPDSGLIRELANILRERFPELDNERIEPCREIFFGVSLLYFKVYYPGCMLILSSIEDIIINMYKEFERHLRFYEIPGGIIDKQLAVGAFRRKDVAKLPDDQPINICWTILEQKSPKHYKLMNSI